MNCLSDSCNVTGTERMVTCWLCIGHCHLKCSGLKNRDADALADSSKFLQWTCPKCRAIDIEFYKFFKSSKGDFEQLTRDFLSLQNKLLAFGELFNKFPILDKFVNLQQPSSPKRKKPAN